MELLGGHSSRLGKPDLAQVVVDFSSGRFVCNG